MITKFENFDGDITYDEILYKYEFSEPIKKYFLDNYTSNLKLLGRTGHAISYNAAKNILKFAKHKNDKKLIDLVQQHIQRLNDPDIQANYNLNKNTKSYNL